MIAVGDAVWFVPTDDHVTPPILEGLTGRRGEVSEPLGEGLYSVLFGTFGPHDRRLIGQVQVHEDQLVDEPPLGE